MAIGPNLLSNRGSFCVLMERGARKGEWQIGPVLIMRGARFAIPKLSCLKGIAGLACWPLSGGGLSF